MATPASPARPLLDTGIQSKLAMFSLARLGLITLVLVTTIFLKQEVLGESVVLQIYGVLFASFGLSLVNVAFWEQTMQARYYLPSQLLYDLLLTSFLVYLTGVNDSIFLFLYLINIVFASLVYQLNGALLVAALSGAVYAFIYFANVEVDGASEFFNLAYNELLFLLTALLCGQLMDELRRQKAQLETQQKNIARLELLNNRLLNSIPVGIVTVDAEDYVDSVNVTALSLLGLDHLPHVRLKYYELLPTLHGILRAWEKMSEIQRLRFTFTHASSAAELSFNLVPFRPALGKPPEEDTASHIFVIEDVSKLRELEKRLEFESRLAATGELAAGIAHEIRNPLASISGSIDMLSQSLELPVEADRRLFEIAQREIARLNHLITDFLEFAKPRDESADDFELATSVREVTEALLNGPGQGKIEFSLDILPNLCLHASRERIKQVFFNLFLNSTQAAGERSVKINVRARENGFGHVTIDVIDNGPGIPPALGAKVFDPFFTTKAEGTGLGLSTVARIIKVAKGEIRILPTNQGAHFQLSLPASSSMELTGSTG